MPSARLFISSKFSYFFVTINETSDSSFEIIVYFLDDPFQDTSQKR